MFVELGLVVHNVILKLAHFSSVVLFLKGKNLAPAASNPVKFRRQHLPPERPPHRASKGWLGRMLRKMSALSGFAAVGAFLIRFDQLAANRVGIGNSGQIVFFCSCCVFFSVAGDGEGGVVEENEVGKGDAGVFYHAAVFVSSPHPPGAPQVAPSSVRVSFPFIRPLKTGSTFSRFSTKPSNNVFSKISRTKSI